MPEALETGETAALFVRVLVALGAGFLIGLERGWRQRDEKSGDRAAGVRTYAFYGLFGGLAGVAPGDWTLPAASLQVQSMTSSVCPFTRGISTASSPASKSSR